MKRLLLTLGLIALPAVASAQQAEMVEYYQADLVGSIRIVYDANGNVIGRQDFTPFGTPVAIASIPEGFVGNEKDDETQQMYFHARSLAARTGRFGRVDPVFASIGNPQGLNRYAYALNNPISLTDRYGLAADSCVPYTTTVSNPDGTETPVFHTCDSGGGGGGFFSWLTGLFKGGGNGGGDGPIFLGGGGGSGGAGAGGDVGGGLSGGGGFGRSTPSNGSSANSAGPNNGNTPGTGTPSSPGSNPAPAAQGPSATGDAQVNAIAAGVSNSAASLFTQPTTYGVILVGSAAPAALQGGIGLAAAGLTQAGIAVEAFMGAYVIATPVVQNYELAPNGFTQGVMDIFQGQTPGPSIGSKLMTISNLISCWGGC